MTLFQKALEDARKRANASAAKYGMGLEYYLRGREQATGGTVHKPPTPFPNYFDEMCWNRGVADRCNEMSAEAAKIPLLFPDEKNNPHCK